MEEQPLFDDPSINRTYHELRSQPGHPNDAIEQPAVRSLIPTLQDKVVVDLGCGAGAMARWATQQGAASVHAYDASRRMIDEATRLTSDPRIRYEQRRIEDLDLAADSIDVVMSGLALHYVADFERVANLVANGLKQSGTFVFSVEHLIMTCADRNWVEAPNGTRLHWPVDRYLHEGPRLVQWLGAEVPRQHRTVAHYLNALIDAGLLIRRVLEPGPDTATLKQWPNLADHLPRPSFLLLRADRPSA